MVDSKQLAVIARLKFEGAVKGICITCDQDQLVVQANKNIFKWNLNKVSKQDVHEMVGSKKFLKSPSNPSKIYTGDANKNFNEVSILTGTEVTRSFKCPNSVQKIATNAEETLAYILCGKQ